LAQCLAFSGRAIDCPQHLVDILIHLLRKVAEGGRLGNIRPLERVVPSIINLLTNTRDILTDKDT
jgi:hypothetical protein